MPRTNGLVPRLTRGDDSCRSGCEDGVGDWSEPWKEYGSYCLLIGVATSTWLDLSASGWHMHKDSMQDLCYRHQIKGRQDFFCDASGICKRNNSLIVLHIVATSLSSWFGVIFHQPSASLWTFLKSLLSYPDIVQHFPWQIECLLIHIYTERYACTKNHTNKVIKTLKM